MDVNAVDEDGDPALYYALSNGNFGMADILLSYGADPNVVGSSGSVLHVAADQGWTEVLSGLVKHGANVNDRNASGLTAAMLAAGGGKDDAIRVLHKHGADLDAVDSDGDSALYYAASRGRVSAAKLLLSLGATPDPRPGAARRHSWSRPLLLRRFTHARPVRQAATTGALFSPCCVLAPTHR